MRKQTLAALLTAVLLPPAFPSRYRITGADFDIHGRTRPYAIDQNVEIDENRVFEDEDELMKYIGDYKTRLENLRAFSTVDVDFRVGEEDESGLCPVTLDVTARDSHHFIAMPYPSYNSNSGFKFKLKAKDTNFFGTLTEMSGDFNFEAENNQETEETDYSFGFNLDFDIPFRLGVFDVTWANSHTFSYTIGESTPEWNFKTGLCLSLPFERQKFSLDFEFYQSFIRDLDYEDKYINKVPYHYGDGTYFVENARVSLPVELQEIDGWGKVYYKPYIDFLYNWDFDGIDARNEDLLGPELTVGQTLSTERINWIGNFRDGASASITPSVGYNFEKADYIPGIVMEFKGYKAFKYAGLCADIYIFAYLNGTNKIGGRLRGIADDQYFNDASGHSNEYACETPAAIVFSFDLPVHIFTTDWESVPVIRRIPFMKYLNFEMQLSPFVDFALIHNRATGTTFGYKDGFYAGGIEALLFPEKWRGITVRASLGVDLGRFLIKRFVNQAWRDSVSRYELSIGIGLQY